MYKRQVERCLATLRITMALDRPPRKAMAIMAMRAMAITISTRVKPLDLP